VVLQGDADSFALGRDNANWQELLHPDLQGQGGWVVESHSHPIDPARGVTAAAAYFPSGGQPGSDFHNLVTEAVYYGRSVEQTIRITTPEGPATTRFGYDSGPPEPYFVDAPSPIGGPRELERFATIEEYHGWMEERFPEVRMGEIPPDFPGLARPPRSPSRRSRSDDHTEGPATGGVPPISEPGLPHRVLGDPVFADARAARRAAPRRPDGPDRRRGRRPGRWPPVAEEVPVSDPESCGCSTARPTRPGRHGRARRGLISVSHAPGGHQDFGRGFYLTVDRWRPVYADVRTGQRGGGLRHVLQFDGPVRDLGTVVDIRPGGSPRAQWDAFRDQPPIPGMDLPGMRTTREFLGGLGVEQRGVFFERFLAQIGMTDADTIVGPLGDATTKGISGGGETVQVAIRSQEVADRLNAIIRGAGPAAW
jgi:hypothetical protein